MHPAHNSPVDRRRSVWPRPLTPALRSVRGRNHGFSLIELMVGIAVSLICTIAVMAAFAVFEGQKRTTSSGDDAQQNGSFSLYTLERQIRTAGSGLVQGKSYGLWGCPIQAKIAGATRLPAGTLPAPFNLWTTTLAMPVLIVDGGTDASGHALPDVIGVVSGNPAGRVFKATVSSAPDSSHVVVTNSFGIFANDYLLGTLAGGNCALGLASADPTVANNIALNTASSVSAGMTGASNVYDLGAAPVVNLFGVNPTTRSLDSYDLLQRPINGAAPGAISIADGIVQIKALYGIHLTGADPASIDSWVKPTGSWSMATLTASSLAANNAVNQIKAVRVVVVARSALPERATDYTTGVSSMKLFPDLAASGLSYTITTDPQYRYKVYDTTIPIRNSMISKYF
jgi:type IV pilus assembly protein PilW